MTSIPMKHRLFSNNRWINTEVFCEQFDIDTNTIYQNRYLGNYPKDMIKEGFIDTHYFFRRFEFRERVRLEAQKIYFVITRYWSQFEVAEMLNISMPEVSKVSWNSFMQEGLFSTAQSLTNLKIPERLWMFWKWARSLIRWVLAKAGLRYHDVDIERLHDVEKV